MPWYDLQSVIKNKISEFSILDYRWRLFASTQIKDVLKKRKLFAMICWKVKDISYALDMFLQKTKFDEMKNECDGCKSLKSGHRGRVSKTWIHRVFRNNQTSEMLFPKCLHHTTKCQNVLLGNRYQGSECEDDLPQRWRIKVSNLYTRRDINESTAGKARKGRSPASCW